MCPDLEKNCQFGPRIKFFCQFGGLFIIWQIFEPTMAIVLNYWANFHSCKWPDIEQMGNLFTLIKTIKKPKMSFLFLLSLRQFEASETVDSRFKQHHRNKTFCIQGQENSTDNYLLYYYYLIVPT